MSLSARTQQLLEEARKEAEPSAEDLRRVRARLTTSLGAENPAIAAVPVAFLKVGALVASAALGLGAWQWAKSRPSEVTVAPVEAAQPVSCPPVSECPAPIVTQVPVPAECTPVKAVQCTPAPKPSGREAEDERSLRTLRFTVPADVADRWALEVGLLIDSRVAVDEGRALDALGHVQRHAVLFPDSSFKEERLALEVLATCQAGRPELAKTPFVTLLELEPTSTYLPRIRSTCGADFELTSPEAGDE